MGYEKEGKMKEIQFKSIGNSNFEIGHSPSTFSLMRGEGYSPLRLAEMPHFCEDERKGPSQNLLECVEKVYGLRPLRFGKMGNIVSQPGLTLTRSIDTCIEYLGVVRTDGAQPCSKSPGRSNFMIIPTFVVKNPVNPVKKTVSISVNQCQEKPCQKVLCGQKIRGFKMRAGRSSLRASGFKMRAVARQWHKNERPCAPRCTKTPPKPHFLFKNKENRKIQGLTTNDYPLTTILPIEPNFKIGNFDA